MGLSWGLVGGVRGREREDAKLDFWRGELASHGIRSLFQGHSPGGATV